LGFIRAKTFFGSTRGGMTGCWNFLQPSQNVAKEGRHWGYHRGDVGSRTFRSLLALGTLFCRCTSSLNSCLAVTYLSERCTNLFWYACMSVHTRSPPSPPPNLVFFSPQTRMQKKKACLSFLNDTALGVLCFEVCEIHTCIQLDNFHSFLLK